MRVRCVLKQCLSKQRGCDLRNSNIVPLTLEAACPSYDCREWRDVCSLYSDPVDPVDPVAPVAHSVGPHRRRWYGTYHGVLYYSGCITNGQ